MSRARRIAFVAWIGVSTALIRIVFFGLTSLVIAWFEENEGVANPVTDLGYGALIGILITGGLLVQLRSPERKIAGVQQAQSSTRAVTWCRRLRDKCGTRDGGPSPLSVLDLRFGVA